MILATLLHTHFLPQYSYITDIFSFFLLRAILILPRTHSFLDILIIYSTLTFFTNIYSSIFSYSYIFFSTLPFFTSFCFQIVLTQAFSILEKCLVLNFARATCVFFTFSSCFVGTPCFDTFYKVATKISHLLSYE